MSYWIKEKNPDFGKIHMSWSNRSYSRMFIKILTWLLMAFVLAIISAIVVYSFVPPEKAHPLIRMLFFLVFIYGIVSAFVGCVYRGQKYSITEKELVNHQPLWKGGILAVWLRERLGVAQKYIEYLPLNKITKINKGDKHLQVVLEDEGELTVAVSPVLEVTRVVTDGTTTTRRIDGFGARLFQTDAKMDKDVLKQITEKLHALIPASREDTRYKRKHK